VPVFENIVRCLPSLDQIDDPPLPDATVEVLSHTLQTTVNPQLGETEINRLNELIDTYQMKSLRDYIWDQGLHKFFNARYHSLKGVPEKEMSVKQIGEELTLPAIFDEAQVVKSFVEKNKDGKVVNRTDGIASVGSAALDNEECWLYQTFLRSLGLVYIEHQARI